MKRISLFFVLLVFSAVTDAQWRGGSNYNWFHIDGCYREDYGVLKNLHLYRDLIELDLQGMHLAGQRRLRIGIYHSRDIQTGTIIDSSGGNLPPQQRQNLADLLRMIHEAGFEEVMIAFHPILGNSPITWTGNSWTTVHESYFQENWNLIYNLMPIIRSSPVPYRIDLGNELAPSSKSAEVWKTYVWKLWWNFSHVFGVSESLGFSVAPGSVVDRIARFRNTYGNNPPHLFSFHIYDNAYQTFQNIHSALNSNGFRAQGLILGEVYYNDATAASHLRLALINTPRVVHYIAQWPITRNSSCSDVNVAPPIDFGHYIHEGF